MYSSIVKLIVTPPAAFLIVLMTIVVMSRILSRLAFKHKGPIGDMEKSYACGEDMPTALIQPDYSEFFPFAFFFTILHIVALIIATVPKGTFGTLCMAAIYISGAIVGLLILFRRS